MRELAVPIRSDNRAQVGVGVRMGRGELCGHLALGFAQAHWIGARPNAEVGRVEARTHVIEAYGSVARRAGVFVRLARLVVAGDAVGSQGYFGPALALLVEFSEE